MIITSVLKLTWISGHWKRSVHLSKVGVDLPRKKWTKLVSMNWAGKNISTGGNVSDGGNVISREIYKHGRFRLTTTGMRASVLKK
jgi:hypothetical protein